MPAFNLYLTGFWFNQCMHEEPTKEEIIYDLFYDGIHNYPAEWITPEMITIQKETL